MARPTSRVLRLLELLESAGDRTGAELAELLGVDQRTVRRYVDQLRELDIPVEALRGRYGGYRLGAGYRMPPLMFSDDEAVAVVLALVAGTTPGGVDDAARATALAKVRRVLPRPTASRAEALVETATLAERTDNSAVDGATLLTAADAVRNHRPLAIAYRNADGRRSTRTVHPYELIARERRWYLVAADVDRGAVRTFRLDRISSARALPGTFTAPEQAGDERAVDRLVDHFARAEYRHRVALRVQASEQHIRAILPQSVAVIQPIGTHEPTRDASGWFRVHIRAARLNWLPGVIASLNCPIVIEEPDELRQLVGDLAARLFETARVEPSAAD